MLKILLFIAFLGWGNASETLAMMDTDDERGGLPMTSKRQSRPENCCTRMMNCLFPCFQTKPNKTQIVKNPMDLGGKKKYGNFSKEQIQEASKLLLEGDDDENPPHKLTFTNENTSFLNTDDNPVTQPPQSQNSANLRTNRSMYSKNESDTGQKSFKTSQANNSIESKNNNSITSGKNGSIVSLPHNTSIQNDLNTANSEFHVADEDTLLMVGKYVSDATEKEINEQEEKNAKKPDYFNIRRGQPNPDNQGSEERNKSFCSQLYNWCCFSSSSTETPRPVISDSVSSNETSITSGQSLTHSEYTKKNNVQYIEATVTKTTFLS